MSHRSNADPASAPPGSWPRAHRAARRLVRPVEELLATESASAVLLGVTTLVALAWANSPDAPAYHALWETPLSLSIGSHALVTTPRVLVDEVLMTGFFFLVGLEIRRELARGELSEPRRAALPFAAALGGMLVPAVVYAALNVEGEHLRGWGVPMATDIAFALAALGMLGRRVSPALRILLLALAVIDDVGAILVIGLVYSSGFSLVGLAVAAGGMLGIVLLQRLGVRRVVAYVVPGAVVWLGLHAAGIHATLAGVLVGLATPAVAWQPREAVSDTLERALVRLRGDDPIDLSMSELDAVAREAVAPVDALQHALHRPVAFVVMPLFALANAGVTFGDVTIDSDTTLLALGTALGLVVGKPVGIVLGSFLATRLGAALPAGVTWRGLWVIGAVGGVGFTMSLFVADLAFEGPSHDVAKAAVLVASAAAAVVALVAGRALLPRDGDGRATTESQAEQSTDQ